jgi:hypothetical protein
VKNRGLFVASVTRRLFASRYDAVAPAVEMFAQGGHSHAHATSSEVCRVLARMGNVPYGTAHLPILRLGAAMEFKYEGSVGQRKPSLLGGAC